MIKPTSNNLQVIPYERPDQSPGGLVIPASYKQDLSGKMWEIVAVGPGRRLRWGMRAPVEPRIGDIVEVDNPATVEAISVRLDTGATLLYFVNEMHISHIRHSPSWEQE